MPEQRVEMLKEKPKWFLFKQLLEMYRTDNNAYPITSTYAGYHTVGCGITGTLSGPSGYIPNLAPQYMAVLPADPSNNYGCWNGYLYYSPDGINYKLLDHGVMESLPAVGTKFYDPVRPTWSWKLCSAGASLQQLVKT